MIGRRRFLAITTFAFTTAIHANPPPTATRSVAQIVAGIDRTYRTVSDFEADFSQVVHNRLAGGVLYRSGHVRFKRPMLFRLEYRRPSGNLDVCDGTTVWAYDANSNAAVQAPVGQSQFPAIFAFLGPTPMVQQYSFRLIPTPDAPTYWVLEARPITAMPSVERVVLYVRRRSSEVTTVILIDAQGNTTRIDFRQARINTGVPATVMFQWVPLANVRVVAMPQPNAPAPSPPPTVTPVRPPSP